MKKISWLIITLLLTLSVTTAYAAETSWLNYWNKVTVLTLETEDLQPSVLNLQDPVKSVEQSLAAAKKIQKQLKALNPPDNLKQNHALRLNGMSYLIGGLTSFKEALSTKNNDWKNTVAIEKIQKATEDLAMAQMGLAAICQNNLEEQKKYTYQEELCLYWANMTVKEYAMNQDIQKILQISLDLLKTKDGAKINDMVLSLESLQKNIQEMSSKMQEYQPSSGVAELHAKKLIVVNLANEVMLGVNQLIKNDKFDNIINFMDKTNDLVEAQKDYAGLFKNMLNKK